MDRYEEAVRQALAFIEANRIPGSALWRRHDGADDIAVYNLYHGAAGIVVFLLERYAASGDDALLGRAVEAGDEISAYLDTGPDLPVDPSWGRAGFAFAFGELARAGGGDRFAEAARRCLADIEAASVPLGVGRGWIEPMPFSNLHGITEPREVWDVAVGAAGVLLTLLWAVEAGILDGVPPYVTGVADRLAEVGVSTDHGARWTMMPDIPWPFTTPNFAHGSAGVGFTFARLYRHIGDPRHLEMAKSACAYTMSRAEPVGKGLAVCHIEEDDPHRYYLGACHGPAGTGRLLLELADLTGDTTYLVHLGSLLDGLEALGAPEERSEGLWNNHSQCCGDAGIGDFALLAHARTGDERHLDLARRCAEVILASSEVRDGQRCWRFAEHRRAPDFIEAQTGYFQGAAGVASFLGHLHGTLEGNPSRILLPDEPAAAP